MSLPSLALAPTVVGHRGASGCRPEHTLAAYREAIAHGADDIELDLVITRDGVLVARHERELSATTDVARHPELAARRTTRVVDGVPVTGWFADDLTLAELRTLTTRERWPDLRPTNTAYDGAERVPTFDEVLALVAAESARRGRGIGVMVELKDTADLAARGLAVDGPLLADLARHGLDHPWARVTIMAFEPAVLRRLAGRTRLPLVQLIDHERRALATPAGLDEVDEYADGIGPHKTLVLPPGPDGWLAGPSGLVREAHGRGLTVHVWTLRAENRHLPRDFRRGGDPGAHGDLAAEVRALVDAGVDGLITDHPDLVRVAAM
jgi:glycerophosphoryl diester phosphodiesterase